MTWIFVLLGIVCMGLSSWMAYGAAEKLAWLVAMPDAKKPEDAERRQVLDADETIVALRDLKPKQVAIGGVVLGVLGMLSTSIEPSLNTATTLLAVAGIAVIGPRIIADQQSSARRESIRKALPAMVDILLLCIRAGLSIERAFEKTSDEISAINPALADEMHTLVTEMKAGVRFSEALRRLAERIDVEAMTRLSGLVAQATRLGTSLGEIFERFSEQQRAERSALLEELAGGMSVKMSIPMALFLLPCCLLMVLGPAVVMGMRTMGGG